MTDHYAAIVPMMAACPVSHMGHYYDLGTTLMALRGNKYVGLSSSNKLFTDQERISIIRRQWQNESVTFLNVKSPGETIAEAFFDLPGSGRKILQIVVGSDRLDFGNRLIKSLTEGKIPEMEGHFWDSIWLHTPENCRWHELSGTNLRRAVSEDDLETFFRHIGFADNSGFIWKRMKEGLKEGSIKIKRLG